MPSAAVRPDSLPDALEQQRNSTRVRPFVEPPIVCQARSDFRHRRANSPRASAFTTSIVTMFLEAEALRPSRGRGKMKSNAWRHRAGEANLFGARDSLRSRTQPFCRLQREPFGLKNPFRRIYAQRSVMRKACPSWVISS